MYVVLMMWHRMNANSELSSGTSLLGIGIRLRIVEGSARVAPMIGSSWIYALLVHETHNSVERHS